MTHPRLLALLSPAVLAAFALGAASLPLAGARAQPNRAVTTPVPILMYHLVSDPPARAPFPELYVRPSDFQGQVRWLAVHGYTGVTLKTVWDAWHGQGRLPAHPVVFTFDDGYKSIAIRARPILQARGWPGVLNLKVGNISDRWGFGAGRIRGLIRADWEIDSHTLTHPDLTSLDATRLKQEIAGSRASIRRRFHVPVDFFCYPSGRYDDAVVARVEAAGYLGATTTNYGLARPVDPYRLSRIRVNRSDGVGGLAAKLRAQGLP